MKNVIVLSLLLLSFVVIPKSASAQSQINTLSIEPAVLNLELDSDNKTSSIVVITNQYDSEIKLVSELKGIEDQSGRIIPSGDVDSVVENSVKLSATDFSIPPHSRYFLTVTVNDSPELTAGGHYATLVFTDKSKAAEKSSIKFQLSVGIFITKKQGAIKKIELTKHEFTKNRFSFPSSASLEFINDGNVHLTPRGYLRIYDKKMVYYETVLNTQSKVILPLKRYAQELQINIQDSSWLPKKITTELGYRGDGIADAKFYKEYFWYIPLRFLLIVASSLGGLVLVSILLRRKFKG